MVWPHLQLKSMDHTLLTAFTAGDRRVFWLCFDQYVDHIYSWRAAAWFDYVFTNKLLTAFTAGDRQRGLTMFWPTHVWLHLQLVTDSVVWLCFDTLWPHLLLATDSVIDYVLTAFTAGDRQRGLTMFWWFDYVLIAFTAVDQERGLTMFWPHLQLPTDRAWFDYVLTTKFWQHLQLQTDSVVWTAFTAAGLRPRFDRIYSCRPTAWFWPRVQLQAFDHALTAFTAADQRRVFDRIYSCRPLTMLWPHLQLQAFDHALTMHLQLQAFDHAFTADVFWPYLQLKTRTMITSVALNAGTCPRSETCILTMRPINIFKLEKD